MARTAPGRSHLSNLGVSCILALLLFDQTEAKTVRAEDGVDNQSAPEAERFSFAGLILDISAHTLTDAEGNDLSLTPAEFNLLTAFVRGAGRALSRDQLMQAAYGRDAEVFDRSVDVLVGRLRRKIEPDPRIPRLIVTLPTVGYKFAVRPR